MAGFSKVAGGHFISASNFYTTDLLFYRTGLTPAVWSYQPSSGTYQHVFYSAGLPSTCDSVLVGNFGSSTGFDDLACYQSSAGQLTFYSTSGTGTFVQFGQPQTLVPSATIIVTGHFANANVYADLLLYNSSTGDLNLYSIVSGTTASLKSYPGWSPGSQFAVTGNFGGGNQYSDIAFFKNKSPLNDQTVGVNEDYSTKIFSTDGAGNLTLIRTADTWGIGWTLVVAGGFGSGDQLTNIALYDSKSGTLELRGFDLNPTWQENLLPGDATWHFSVGAAGGTIQGYASPPSVNRGGSLKFYVDSQSSGMAKGYTLTIYRMGWYSGLGGRNVFARHFSGIAQAVPPLTILK
jgi:hypothetical protein